MVGILWLFPVILFILKIITKQQVTVFVMIFLFCILGFLLTNNELEKRDAIYCLEEQKIEVEGQISKIVQTPYGFCVYLQNVEYHEKMYHQVIVYTEDVKGLKIGNTIKVIGKLKQFSTARNKGNFDSKKYYMSLGIYMGISAKKVEVMDSHYDFIRQKLYQLKDDITNKLEKICNAETKGIFKLLSNKNTIFQGILLGDKSDMDVALKELYSLSGISHILAIRGLHVSIIGMFLYNQFRRRFSFGASMAVSVTVVVMFGILSGMGIATIRAFVMFGLKLLGEVLGRTYDYLTAISLAGLLLFMGNPFVIFHSGFQMSFAAIISVVIVWKKIVYILDLNEKKEKEGILKKIKRKIRNSILCSLTVSVFMNPIVAYYYFTLPTYSFLLNVVVIPFMSIVVVSGAIGIIFAYIGTGVARLVVLPGGVVLEVYETLCEFVLKMSFSSVIVGQPSITIVFLYYILILIFLFVLEKRKKKQQIKKEAISMPENGMRLQNYLNNKKKINSNKKFVILLLIFAVMLNMLTYFYLPVSRFFTERDILKITTIDVGQGDGIIIRTPDNQVITVDGGSTTVKNVGKYRMIPFLKSQGIEEIDYAFMTHADIDHISGLVEMLEQSDNYGVKVKNLVLPDIKERDNAYNQMIQTAHQHKVNVLYITKGDYIKFNHVELKCMHPTNTMTAEDRNSYSTVLSITYNKFSMLFTGDISSEQEDKLGETMNHDYTILKVAHHGSKSSTSDEFLRQINPKYSLISVGEGNMYGHPARETLERLKQSSSQILRTDESGGITVSTDGEKMKIYTFIK